MKTSKLLTVTFLATLLMLTGCTSLPPLNFTPTDIQFSTERIDGDLRNVNVSVANDKETTGELQVGYFGNQYESSFRTTFKDALEEALVTSGVFDPSSNIKVSVFAKITRFETPSFGVNFPTDMDVLYKVQNLNNGQIIFEKTVSSVGEVEGTYSFFGEIRGTEARNRSVQNNIRNFIKELRQFADSLKQTTKMPKP